MKLFKCKVYKGQGADASKRRNDPDTDAWKRQLL